MTTFENEFRKLRMEQNRLDVETNAYKEAFAQKMKSEYGGEIYNYTEPVPVRIKQRNVIRRFISKIAKRVSKWLANV